MIIFKTAPGLFYSSLSSFSTTYISIRVLIIGHFLMNSLPLTYPPSRMF